MATIKQKEALNRIVENGGNVSRAMMEVGYTPATAKTPQKLTESKGFKELLAESGLTEDLVAKALADDIKAKPRRRVGELSLASDVLGMRKREDAGSGNITVNILNFDGGQSSTQLRSDPTALPA